MGSISILSPILFLAILFSGFMLKCESRIVVGASNDAYEAMEEYDFPAGILPQGVAGYDLDSSSGRFEAYFNGTCSFSLEGSYELRYKSTIKGHISKGRLSGLEGVSVKLFLFWVDIVEVTRKGGDLNFSVGIAGAGFPVENFEESPKCGCGLNCNSLVSSS